MQKYAYAYAVRRTYVRSSTQYAVFLLLLARRVYTIRFSHSFEPFGTIRTNSYTNFFFSNELRRVAHNLILEKSSSVAHTQAHIY